MAVPEYLQTARDRMETAQKTMLAFLDGGGGDMNIRLALLQELNSRMADFNEAVARAIRESSAN
jgi:hypothetical protein